MQFMTCYTQKIGRLEHVQTKESRSNEIEELSKFILIEQMDDSSDRKQAHS